MQIITAKEYNQLKHQKWREAVEEWKNRGIDRQYDIIPQIMIFGFRNRYTGEYRNYGFVLYEDRSAYWFKTKKEGLAKRISLGLKKV